MPCHLPVMLLVQVANRYCVREQLVEIFDTLLARGFVECDGQSDQMPVRLRFVTALVQYGFCVLQDFVRFSNVRHDISPLSV